VDRQSAAIFHLMCRSTSRLNSTNPPPIFYSRPQRGKGKFGALRGRGGDWIDEGAMPALARTIAAL
jgi:hypothetical protein